MQFYCFNLHKASNNFETHQLFYWKNCIKLFVCYKSIAKAICLVSFNNKDASFMQTLFFYRNVFVIFLYFTIFYDKIYLHVI